jgi:Domain of Unknown Function (DUF928)
MTAQPARKLTRKLITACLAACLLPIALPMLPATATPSYKPPSRKSAQRTEGTGRRNAAKCPGDLTAPLTLLMPTTTEETVPQTTLTAPPLYLYVAKLAKPKKFSVILYVQRDLGSVIQSPIEVWRDTPQVQSGIVKIDYLAGKQQLEIGKTYTWKVEIDCGQDSNGMARSLATTTANIIRVAEPEALQPQLQSATSARQRAEIYAQAGLWTEALTAVVEARAGGQDTAADQDFQVLLNQIGLKQTAGGIVKLEQASPSPAAPPVVAPSPSASVVPTPTPKVPTPAKPTDPKKPCH